MALPVFQINSGVDFGSNASELSIDKKIFYMVSGDGRTILLRDTASGRLLQTLNLPIKNTILTLLEIKKDTLLISATDRLLVFNVRTGHILYDKKNKYSFFKATLNRDRTQVALFKGAYFRKGGMITESRLGSKSDYYPFVEIRDVNTLDILHICPALERYASSRPFVPNAVEFLNDGTLLIGYGSHLYAYDPALKKRKRLTSFSNDIESIVSLTPERLIVVTAGDENQTTGRSYLYQMPGLKEVRKDEYVMKETAFEKKDCRMVHTVPDPVFINNALFAAQTGKAAAPQNGNVTNTIGVFELKTGRLLRTLPNRHNDSINALFYANGTIITNSRALISSNPLTGKRVFNTPPAFPQDQFTVYDQTGVVFSHVKEGRFVLYKRGKNSSIHFMDVNLKKRSVKTCSRDNIKDFRYSEGILTVLTENGSIETLTDFNAPNQTPKKKPPSFVGKDSRLLDGKTGAYDYERRTIRHYLPGHLGRPTGLKLPLPGYNEKGGIFDDDYRLALSRSGRYLVIFGVYIEEDFLSSLFHTSGIHSYPTLSIVDLKSKKRVATLVDEKEDTSWDFRPPCFAFSEDESLFAAGTRYGRVHLVDLEKGSSRDIKVDMPFIRDLALNTKTQELAMVHKSLKIVSLKNGNEISTHESNGNHIAHVTSSDGYWITIGFDQSINILSGDSHEPLLSGYINYQQGNNSGVIFSTPDGYFDFIGNPGDFIHFSIPEKRVWYSYNQLYELFFRPDIVKNVLNKGPYEQDVRLVNLKDSLLLPPPEVNFSVKRSKNRHQATLKIRANNSGGGIGDIRVKNNGKFVYSYQGHFRLNEPKDTASPKVVAQANAHRGLTLKGAGKTGKAPASSIKIPNPLSVTVPLASGNNQIVVQGFNGAGTVLSSPVDRVVKGGKNKSRPRLFVLSIGIDQFKEPNATLKNAVKDSNDVEALLRKHAAFRIGETLVLNNANAQKETIINAFNRLAEQMNPEDYFVIYFATHAEAINNKQFRLYTHDYDGEATHANTILYDELMAMHAKNPAQHQLLILDTCRAGGLNLAMADVYNIQTETFAYSTGIHVIAGSSTYQDALDNYHDNGLFTHALLEGYRHFSDSDINSDGFLSIVELADYAKKKTNQFSHGRQQAVSHHFGDDFHIIKK